MGLRFVALLVDLVVLIPAFVIMAILFGETEASTSSSGASSNANLSGMGFVAYLLVVVGYYVVCERVWGCTLGKRGTGLRVVRADGSQVSWGQALGRNLLRLVDALPVMYLIGAICVWATQSNQRIGDLAARTFVVHRTAIGVEPVAPATS